MTVQLIYRTICDECNFIQDSEPETIFQRNNPTTFPIYRNGHNWQSHSFRGLPTADYCTKHKIILKIESQGDKGQ